MKNAANILLILMMTGMVAACVSGKPHEDSYTDQSGKKILIEDDRAQCSRACNADYSRCMDTAPAHSNPVEGSPAGMFGASADCRAALQSCLPECKSR